MSSSGSVRPDFARLREQLPAIQAALVEQGVDAWLLYDLHARNPVAGALLGLGDLTRRYFVVLPAEGEPVAVVNGIEEQPWERWPWRAERYVAWRELDEALPRALGGARTVALEAVDRDAVPALDVLPWGVVDLIRSFGAETVPSGELVTRFYARWTPEQLASHRRAAAVLGDVARAAFRRAADAVRAGGTGHEGELRDWILAELDRRGCGVGADSIVAVGPNAANPHYAPEGAGAPIRRGDVLLIDLWAKEADERVYADQTWMGVLADRLPDDVEPLWTAIRDARDAGVAFLRERWQNGETPAGYEVDDVVRGVVRKRGFGDAFFHRTGHSIDRATHGAGPNIDNYETHEVRRLVPGIGFSIEPGIYLPGRVGLRTEINVYMSDDGPVVTTPDPQDRVFALLAEP